MIFSVEREVKAEFSFDLTKLGKKVAEAVLREEEFPFLAPDASSAAQISLLLTDDEGIRGYNASYRGLDAPTDVLSFPSVTYERPADFLALDAAEDVYDHDTECYALGDIVLNADRVRSQAMSYGHSVRREAAFLIAHSVLHLIGYDHETDAEREVMEQKQETVLNRLKITRDAE